MKQRIFSMFLVAVMLFTSVDITAFAQENIGVEVTETAAEDEGIQNGEERQEEGTTAPTEEAIEATDEPSMEPDEVLEEEPTEEATVEPGEEPVAEETAEPSAEPTDVPAVEATEEPVVEETVVPEIEETEMEKVISEEETVSEEVEEITPDTASTIVDSGKCGDNLTWELDSEGVLTISGTGRMTDYSEEHPPWYNYGGNLKKLVLNEGITYIGEYAFSGFLYLTGDLVIPNSVADIGTYAFQGCNFTGNLVIPNGVTIIGASAFADNESLDGILSIPSSVTSIEDGAFMRCNSLTGDLVIPNSVTSIGEYAFYQCSDFDGKLTISNSIKNIGEYTFDGCNFTGNLTIPNSVTTIGRHAFMDCSGFTGDLVIPNSVTSIGDGAFWNCSGFDGALTIPSSVVTIDKRAFLSCEKIESINIQHGLERLEDETFFCCDSVTSISLPRSLNYIGEDAIPYNSDLTIYGISGSYAETYAKDNEITFVDKEVVATSIEVLPENPSVGKGLTKQMVLNVTPSDFTDEVVWESSDTSVATVTQSGLISGVDVGTSQITVKVGSLSKQFTVTVTQPVTAITVSPASAEIAVAGESVQLSAAVTPSEASNKEYTWSSEDEDIATVDETGKVTGVSKGTAKIYATSKDESGVSGYSVITVLSDLIPLEEIAFADSEVELAVGDTYVIEVTYNPADTNESKQLTWSSSDTEVATVDNSGKVQVIGYGEAVIEAVSVADENIKDTCTIKVNQYEVQFDSMGGSQIEPVLCDYKQTLDCSEIVPEKENHVFMGWYKDEACQEKWTNEDIITSDIVLYAKWNKVRDGLFVVAIEDQVYTGKAIKPAVEVYDGYTLLQKNKDYTVSYKNNIKPNDASKAKTAPTITVKGKGNYSGTETVTFKILKKDIADADITAADITVEYNKKVQKKVPTVKRGTASLKKDKDFTVTYPDLTGNTKAYKAAGEYIILVKGKGGYTGQREVKLTITESKLMSKVTVSKIAAQPYTGKEVTTATMNKVPTVKYGDKKLKEGTHYTVTYENNVKIGTATMTLTGTDVKTPEGTFTGTKKVTFKIAGTSLAKAKVTGIPKSMTYTGTAINEQTENWGNPIKVVLKGTELTRAVDADSEGDYIVSFSKNTNKGTATVTIKGINSYSGSIKKEFTVNAYNINDNTKQNLVTEEMDTNTVYVKGGCKPEPVVKFGEDTLVKGKDYTLTYANNTKCHDGVSTTKVPTVTITGKGNYKGTVKIKYTIEKQDIGKMNISVADVVYKNKKGAYKGTPVVKDLNNKALTAKTDYAVSEYTYGQDVTLKNGTERKAGDKVEANDIVPGDTLIRVSVTGKGNYKNDTPLFAEYRVVKSTIANAKVTVPAQKYNGEPVTITDKTIIKVMVGKTKLNPEDFEIVDGSFKNNTKAGTASFTIKGVGNYGGTKKATFTIKEKGFDWWWRDEHECDYTHKTRVVSPTCEKEGYTECFCECGKSKEENRVSALGHDWNEWEEKTPATEETEGEETRTCKREGCGEVETRSIPKKEHEHTYETVVTEPTCTEEGYTTYTCSCGDSYVDDIVEELGHDWSAWEETKAATETETGEEKRSCKREDCGAAETRDIPVINFDTYLGAEYIDEERIQLYIDMEQLDTINDETIINILRARKAQGKKYDYICCQYGDLLQEKSISAEVWNAVINVLDTQDEEEEALAIEYTDQEQNEEISFDFFGLTTATEDMEFGLNMIISDEKNGGVVISFPNTTFPCELVCLNTWTESDERNQKYEYACGIEETYFTVWDSQNYYVNIIDLIASYYDFIDGTHGICISGVEKLVADEQYTLKVTSE